MSFGLLRTVTYEGLLRIRGSRKMTREKDRKFRFFTRKPGVKQYVITGIVVVAVFLITYFGAFPSFDFLLSDVIHQKSSSVDLPITIIGIDEKSLGDLGVYTEWKRDVYAGLIDKLCENGRKPAVIAFDILFTGQKDPESDFLFAKACEKAGNVVVGAYVEHEKVIESVDGEFRINKGHIKSIAYPYSELKSSVTCGFTNNELSRDGYARTLITYIDTGDETLESLALTTYRIYAEQNGIAVRDFENEKSRSFLFRYTTKPGGMEHYSLSDVLKDDNSWFADYCDGGIVLVGAYATGFSDDFFVPSNRFQKMYGVEIHANAIEAIHRNTLQSSADNLLISILFAVLSGLMVILVYVTELPFGGAVSAAFIILMILISGALYKNGIYIKQGYFILPALIIYIAAIVYHYISVRSEKARINNAFKMYVAPEVVDEMAGSGNFELKLGGQTKDIAVLFIDIRGFTMMSEGLPPEEVVNILNEYFGLVTDSIFKNKGTLDKFIGDAAMAVFNSPNDLDDYVYRAVHTAWDIALGSQDLAARLLEKFGRTINYGIGVNCGPATVGNIGSSFRMDYTAIGDTVNTSARLEANAKAGQILISQEVYDRTGEWLEVEEIGVIPLKGKSNEIFVYNVTGVKDKPGYNIGKH